MKSFVSVPRKKLAPPRLKIVFSMRLASRHEPARGLDGHPRDALEVEPPQGSVRPARFVRAQIDLSGINARSRVIKKTGGARSMAGVETMLS